MPFKIVKTIENGEFCTWTVPATWESSGILRCPKFNFQKFQRDPHSVPQETWQITDCILVRSNLLSFQAAESEIRLLNDVTNDKDDTHEPTKITPGLEAFAEFLVVEGSKSRSQPQETMSIAAVPPQRSEFTPTQYSTLSSQIDSLTAIVSGVAKKQADICENQEMIINKLSVLFSRFDEVIKRTTGSCAPGKPKEQAGRLKPIADRRSLEELEQSLRNEDTAEEIRKAFSIVCGVGKGRAINNAYALIDAMFDRKFLLECSWSGGSRSDKSKVCFKGYQNTVNLFFQIVYSSDKHFTMMECESFLKCVLKNARQRFKSRKLRASSARNRSKTKRTQNKTDDDEILDLENVCDLVNSVEPDHNAVKLEIEPESEDEDSDYLL